MVSSSITVVRFDVRSGASETIRSFTYPPQYPGHNAESPLVRAKIGNDVVASLEASDRLLVGNWRTGEARVIKDVSTP